MSVIPPEEIERMMKEVEALDEEVLEVSPALNTVAMIKLLELYH